jgi:hypothetical protein
MWVVEQAHSRLAQKSSEDVPTRAPSALRCPPRGTKRPTGANPERRKAASWYRIIDTPLLRDAWAAAMVDVSGIKPVAA